jgi:hypothetical protein
VVSGLLNGLDRLHISSLDHDYGVPGVCHLMTMAPIVRLLDSAARYDTPFPEGCLPAAQLVRNPDFFLRIL